MSATTQGRLPLTAAQQRVVLANDGHLLVGAGAGSGKTSTVVQTLCYRLGGAVIGTDGTTLKHPVPLALTDIAAVTFTNESAADLKRKLRTALKVSDLRELANDVDTARIGTIHGFCGDLMREFALRAGLPPSLGILADGEGAALAAECADLAVQRAAEAQTLATLPALLTNRSLRSIMAAVAELAGDSDRLTTWAHQVHVLRPHEQALFALAQDARDLRIAELRRRGDMDFDRMIVAVRDLLRDNERVRHAVQRKIRLLIVDEFQDVDPTQRDLAFLLGGLEAADPAPTRLMLVGDPKQSIYKFRRADVSLWNDVRDRFADAQVGQQLELSDNFRSRRGILALVDHVVGTRLDEPVNPALGRQPFEVDYRPLTAAGAEAEGDRCVEILAVPAGPDGKTQGNREVRALEAAGVAARMQALQSSGNRYGDMVILLSSFSSVLTYKQALEQAGIPVYVLRGEGFWEAREVLDCLLALRAIRDVRDEVALLGFLRSPFVGVRDETLLALRSAQHPEGLYGALATVSLEAPLLARAQALLAQFGILRDRVGVQELLSRLVTESGFLAALVLDAERGQQAAANIRKLLRVAGSMAELSVGEFLRDVQEARTRGDRVGEERRYRERADVVTITTVHSAKGLEWPIVFWCDLIRESVDNHDALLCGRTLFRLKDDTGAVDEGEKAVDLEHAALKKSLRDEHIAELFRLWYVASTRAKRLLVLSGVPLGTSTKQPLSMATRVRALFPTLANVSPEPTVEYLHNGVTRFEVVIHVVGASAPSDSLLESPAPVPALPSLLPPPAALPMVAGRTRLSATQLMTFAADEQTWWNRYVLGVEESVNRRTVRGAGSTAIMGTVIHEVLERYNFELGDLDELIDTVIDRRDPDAPDVSDEAGGSYRAQIRALVEQAAAHPTWQSLISEPSGRRELAFTRILPDGRTIDGALDLVAMSDGVAQILDVKTGRVIDASHLASRYQVQGDVYVDAVSAITGKPSAFALLSVRDGSVVPVTCDAARVAPLIARMRSLKAT